MGGRNWNYGEHYLLSGGRTEKEPGVWGLYSYLVICVESKKAGEASP